MTAMAPDELLAYWATRPTVMPMQEELSLIRDIRALDTADIAKDLASFVSLIELVHPRRFPEHRHGRHRQGPIVRG